jgi:hypothetical protein
VLRHRKQANNGIIFKKVRGVRMWRGAIATYHTLGAAPLAYPAVSLRSKSKQRDTMCSMSEEFRPLSDPNDDTPSNDGYFNGFCAAVHTRSSARLRLAVR